MKSPIEIVKLLIAEEMSLAVNSSILESIFAIFLAKATSPRTKTGDEPLPIIRNPKVIEIRLLGIGGHG